MRGTHVGNASMLPRLVFFIGRITLCKWCRQPMASCTCWILSCCRCLSGKWAFSGTGALGQKKWHLWPSLRKNRVIWKHDTQAAFRAGGGTYGLMPQSPKNSGLLVDFTARKLGKGHESHFGVCLHSFVFWRAAVVCCVFVLRTVGLARA